ncbi:MAG: EAL domain-containing protein [Proteobacteria bacterium]|nr:EAL domain-containing protein [Pseudomonadota bacterium]MBS0463711.1 EAL domain-containing protein [Pseudomonadota bacterium]
MTQATTPRSVYVLSAPHPAGDELAQRLDSAGFQVEAVDSVDEFRELVLGLSPHALVVDASHVGDLEAVGEIRRQAQLKSRDKSQAIPLLALLPEDNIRSRLQARRAGAGAIVFPPFEIVQIVRNLKTLLAPAATDSERVLIVEDDRAQALFAQSVLNNAGMQAEVEQNPLRVLEALEFQHPELVLMDLHMPDANGVELTALIREHPQFRNTPIVFLSGESDPEARFSAIDAGGDDFLAKPIRPKHLIATVRNRVRRMRELEVPAAAPPERDAESGLYRRAALFARLDAVLADAAASEGGLLFVRIVDSSALRTRIGLAELERLAREAGRVLVGALGASQIAAGIHDNAFLVLAAGLDDAGLDALAARLREQLMASTFQVGGVSLQLRIAVGVCPWRDGFADSATLFDAAERTSREARTLVEGVKRYVSMGTAQRQREAEEVAHLRQAIAEDRIGLAYQPIVAVKGGTDAQYQTLLRLRDAKGQLLAAADILPVAARGNLLLELDRRVLTRALGVARIQRDHGRPVRLFVPQSLASLTAPDQAQWMLAEIFRHGGVGEALVLECRNEDALLNPAALAALGKALHASGVRMCRVQYEHGEQADRLLEADPPAFLKLAPRYLAANAPQDVRNDLSNIIAHAHRLGVKVIAPRVEDAHAAASLWMSGIDYLQGNLVGAVGERLDFDFSDGLF